jgi:thiamine-phosphate pyrophosphorylase
VILHALVAELDTTRAAARGGATVLQLRLKDVSTSERIERGGAIRDLCRAAAITFVVNDDVDAAIELGAEGVHLGREDEGIERARSAGLLLGLSAQTVEEAVRAEADEPDYLGVGPVWPTPTKPDAPVLGLDGLRAASAAVDVPVIAIGGIDAANAAGCLAAGAAGVAVVRASSSLAAIRAAIDHAAV